MKNNMFLSVHCHDAMEEEIILFRQRYDLEPDVCAFAPGRIEILGNHTDYNEGYTLSLATNFGTAAIAAFSDSRKCSVYSVQYSESACFYVDSLEQNPKVHWINFIIGMCSGLQSHQQCERGFNLLISSNLPIGAGLASSASLEMAVGIALSQLYNVTISKIELARIGQIAENKYCGIQSGLLDQLTILFAKTGELVFIDFRTLSVETIPFFEIHDQSLCFMLIDTKVKHSLQESAYNERRQQCQEAFQQLSTMIDRPIDTLRDVTSLELKTISANPDDTYNRRAAHVIGENERVLSALKALKNRDYAEFGRLLFNSHTSSRTNFDNSCPELDFLVDIGHSLEGVYGMRLTGGGFGGATIALINKDHVELLIETFREKYHHQFGYPCAIYLFEPAQGAI